MTDSTEKQSRLIEAMEAYLEQLESGLAPNAERFVGNYPDIEDELRLLLSGLEFIHLASPKLAQFTESSAIVPGRCETFGDYRLIREIGRGGMGVIYEAEQLSLSRRVALKVLPFAAMLDPRQLNRFKNEAHAAAVLHHPHIVPVFGVGCERGVHFYVMQLIEGQSLAQLIETHRSSGQLPEGDTSPIAALSTAGPAAKSGRDRVVVELIVQAAEALGYAHREGVIHRDIKPSNLLVDGSGRLWVADFGLAHVQAGNSLTLSDDVLGTLRYMSPEQLAGDRVVDQRTDVYSLGVTMYELLLRRPAFADENREQLIRHVLEHEPDPPRKLDASIPIDLETVILRAIDKNRDARYQTAQELVEDLRRFLSHEPVRARRATRIRKLRYWAQRNPGVALLAATVFALLISFASVVTINSWRLANIANAQSARLYAANINRAMEAIDRGDLNLARRTLQFYSTPIANRDYRGFEWYYLNDICRKPNSSHELPHHWPVANIAYSPDGKRLATCEMGGQLKLWDALTLKPVWQSSRQDSYFISVAFRRSGQELVLGSRNGLVCILDATTGKVLKSRFVGPQEVFTLSVRSSDGLVAYGKRVPYSNYPARGESEVVVWDPDTDTFVQSYGLTSAIVCLSFSPDGKVLAAGTYDSSIRLWDAVAWHKLSPLAGHSSGVFSLAFSHDGKYLASGSGIWNDHFLVGEVKVWTTADWSLARTLHEHSDRVHTLTFLPDNRTLVSGSSDGTLAVWDTMDDRRQVPLNFMLAHGSGVRSLSVSPIDNGIASGGDDSTARLWPTKELLSSRSNPVRWVGQGVILLDLAFTDHGSHICTSDLGGNIILQDVNSQKNVFALKGTDSIVYLDVNEPEALLALLGQTQIRVYSLATREAMWSWNLPYAYTENDAQGRGHDFSPRGDELAVGSGDTLYFFEARTGTLLRRFGPIGPDAATRWTVRYSPGGRYLALVRDKTYLVDLRSLQLVRTYDTESQRPSALAFSPDGDRLVTAGFDGSIIIWDRASGTVIGRCVGHTGMMSSIEYSSDGRRLLSSSRDSSVRIWDADSFECLMTMSEHQGYVFCARFSPDNQLVASCGEDRSVILRYADTSKQVLREAR